MRFQIKKSLEKYSKHNKNTLPCAENTPQKIRHKGNSKKKSENCARQASLAVSTKNADLDQFELKTSGLTQGGKVFPEIEKHSPYCRYPDDQDGAPALLPGLKPVLEHLEISPQNVDAVYLRTGKGGPAIQRILEICKDAGIRFIFSDGAVLDRMCGANHQGVIARLCAAPNVAVEELVNAVNTAPLPLILALDQIQDPGNLGTLARTLYALGGAGIIVPKHNSVHIGNTAARASAGALARLPIARVTNLSRALEQAEEKGCTIYATGKNESAIDVFKAHLRLPAVLVLGNEEQGIRPGVARRCSETLFIPMAREFDSLNVAQAGAILTACFSQATRK